MLFCMTYYYTIYLRKNTAFNCNSKDIKLPGHKTFYTYFIWFDATSFSLCYIKFKWWFTINNKSFENEICEQRYRQPLPLDCYQNRFYPPIHNFFFENFTWWGNISNTSFFSEIVLLQRAFLHFIQYRQRKS